MWLKSYFLAFSKNKTFVLKMRLGALLGVDYCWELPGVEN